MTRLFTSCRLGGLACLMLLALWPGSVLAATCNSIDPGNWSFTGNWSCNQVPDAGDDVTISHAISMNGADRAARNFTIAAGGQLSDTGNTLTVSGVVVINGTWSGAGGGRLVKSGTGNLSGSGSLTGNTRIDINGNTSILSTTNLTFTDVTDGRIDIGAGITVTNNGTVTLARLTEDDTASTWTNATNATLNVRNDVFPGGGLLNASASGNTVTYSGTINQSVLRPNGGSYFHLTLSGGGTKILTSTVTYGVLGNLTIASGVTYDGNTNDPAVNLGGNFSNNGTFDAGGGTFTFNGGAAQTITGTAGGTTTFSTLALNNASGLSLTGTHDVTAGLVTLTNGRITTNANALYISTGATITTANATRFIVGNLRKRIVLGTNVARQFEVGTEAGGVRYTPLTSVRFGNVTVAGDLTVSTTASDHPQIGSSTLNAAKSVNRYWTFTKDSALTFTANANNRFIFNFINAGDLDAGVNTAGFFFSRYSPALPSLPPTSAWTEITPSATAAATTTLAGVVISSANVNGDYQIAEKSTAPPTPGSFDVFETSQTDTATPKVIRTKVAGTAFSLDVMAITSGAKATTFTGTGADVKLEVLGNAATGVAVDANNCPVSSTVLQTIASFSITNGRSTASFAAQANSWRDVRVRVTYPTSSPTVTRCSTDNFAIRPASFALAATDSNWTTAGAARALSNTSGSTVSPVHKAGQPFRLTVTPSPATATNYATNYTGGPIVSALACVLPVGGNCTTPSLLDPGTFADSGASTRVSDTAKYAEVGAVNVTMRDETYASVDNKAGDTTGDCTATGFWICQSSAPLAVGRFVPDHFVVTAATAPIFRTFDTTDAACSVPPSGSRRSFTYIGQFFGYVPTAIPSAMIEARSATGGTVTTNYRGTLWKLTNASVSQAFANSPVATLDVTQIGTPTVAEVSNTGTGTLTINAADKLAFARNNTTPQGQFAAKLALTLSVSDASEAGTNQGTVTTTTPLVFDDGGNGIAFDGGGADAGKTFRYGQLALASARGAQGAALQVPVEAQYWNGTTFARNTVDHCTTLAATSFGLGNYAGNLDSTKATRTMTGAFLSGQKALTLSVPGSGSVDIVLNLGTTTAIDACLTWAVPTPTPAGANQAYLRGRWCGATYTKDPTARATFGINLGSEEVIYLRENF